MTNNKRSFRGAENFSPLSVLFLVLFTSIFFGLAGRILFFFLANDRINALRAILALARGLIFDLSLGFYSLLLFMPFLAFPERIWRKPAFQITLFSFYFAQFFTLTMATISEIFFIEEFHSRFNFIAVDYLVYTNEVLKNAWQSYPVQWILPVIVLFSIALCRLAFLRFTPQKTNWTARDHAVGLASIVALSGVSLFFLNEGKLLETLPSMEAELSKNSVYALFSAYHNNEIDYRSFYSSNGEQVSTRLVHSALKRDYKNGISGSEDEESIVRNIVAAGPERKLNVVLVLMESMSARFMKSYGPTKDITPNLDSLAGEGLFFDRLYSTGTRTVRGLEAVVLSLPPTPGQSVVRRPEAGNLFSMGTVFREKGYHTEFVYGGRSYFDNMGKFFSSNKFEVYDEGNIPAAERTFSNAWGVADEDLFRYALKRQDEIQKNGPKPFFQFILNTSNHRPYTFPEGRIDLPSGSGRDGAVKYSDFAIGQFIREAKKKPWFKDTVFIFVADHNASVAGGTKVLPADYRIPLIFYSPGNIPTKKISLLASQIDLAPTLFGLLNFSYQTKFFGHDLLRAKTERAFIGTYQTVGLWQNEKLVLLSPNFRVDVSEVKNEIATRISSFVSPANQLPQDEDVQAAVAYYETASSWYQNKRLKEDQRYSTAKNVRGF